ncbi:aldo/keto reductase [Gordonia sp. HY002]|uniref:aldo/keto reductase n=1 Tax=Gordonia zhenghanii TaxID=2911516 RepID=UPI001EF0F8A9|nr:aldo/keto reductase [Gordonia zhenghanii]MCF8571160.1 aldo/keto reductase [Gordonia zhenghanii]MCF8607182.1 aldo/keto reductase [Gordonia zhenghanii]
MADHIVPTIALNNAVHIPQLGFGTFQIPPEDTKAAVTTALEAGYRHIDTAQMYGNEKQVGEAVRESGIPRSEFFVTSKLNNPFHAPADAVEAVSTSIDALDLGPLDLYLIHWPLPEVGDFVETWRALEGEHKAGKARAIGVSNFQQAHLERLLAETEVVPAVNQIEVHPYFQQSPLRAFNREHGIVTEAWAPLGQGAVLDDEVLAAVGSEVGRSVAQVTLRWHLQRGDVVFPKSSTPARAAENFALFDFALSDEQMSRVDALDADRRLGPNPDEFNRV